MVRPEGRAVLERSAVERRRRYHLIVLDEERDHALVALADGRWLLPSLSLAAHQRPYPLEAYLRHLGLQPILIHEFRLPSLDSADVDDHLYCLAIASRRNATLERLTWYPVSRLEDSRAVLGVQADAMRRCVHHVAAPAAAFDDPDQLFAMHAWVAEQTGATMEALARSSSCYRIDRVDSVRSFQTPLGKVYFKGGAVRMREAALTQKLHTLAPDHFPRTLAVDDRRHWWLTAGVSGSWLAETTSDPRPFARYLDVLASVQQRVMQSLDAMALLASDPFEQSQFARATRLALNLLRYGPTTDDEWSPSQLDCVEARLTATWHRLLDLPLPRTWVASDMWGANIFCDEQHVWIIDIEDSFYATPTLALARFFNDLKGRLNVSQDVMDRLKSRYAEAWAAWLDPNLIRNALALTSICGSLMTLISFHDRQTRRAGLELSTDPESASASTAALAQQIARRALTACEHV